MFGALTVHICLPRGAWHQLQYVGPASDQLAQKLVPRYHPTEL